MAESTFWVRTTSNTAAADSLVIGNDTSVQLTFTTDSPYIPGVDDTGDLILEGGGATTTYGQIDPDTWVVVDGQTYRVVFDATGTLPVNNKVPEDLGGSEVVVIRLYSLTDPPVLISSYFFVQPPLDPGVAEALMNDFGNGNLRLVGEVLDPPPEPVCFCSGTDIATPSGLRRVETLRAGDTVLTEDGRVAQVAWVGMSSYSAAQLASDYWRAPVRIPAHAFGPGLPARDLDVSPQHRIVVEGAACELLLGMPRAFVVARHLLGTVAHTPVLEDGVQYVHLLLENHEIVVGNGLPSESFQPARRMLDIMTGDNLERLMAALEVLGAEAMLTRPDALPTLSSREARVFFQSARPAVMTPAQVALTGSDHPLH